MAKEIISITPFNNGDVTVEVPSGLTNSILLARIGTHQGDVTSCSWNGNSMTLIERGVSAFNENGEIWGLLNPTPGSGTFTLSGGGSWVGGDVVLLQNVKQTLSPAKVNATGSNATATAKVVPPEGNAMIIAAMGSEADCTSSLPTSGVRHNQQGQSFENYSGMIYSTKTGIPQAPAFSLSSGQRWGIAVIALEDVSIDSSLVKPHITVGNGMGRNELAT